MAVQRYKDNYCEHFTFGKGDEFKQAVKIHENAIDRIAVTPKMLEFYSISRVNGNEIVLMRLDEDGQMCEKSIRISDEDIPIWSDTSRVTGIAVVSDHGMHTERVIPVSDNVKLSIGNRSTLSYKGLISEQKCSKVALARVMEDLIVSHNRHKLQLIIIEGKLQSILTIRYKATDQPKIFETATSEIKDIEDFGFCGGYVSHTRSIGLWRIKQVDKKIAAYIEVSDSSSGDGGVNICPIISANGKRVAFDDAWFSRHCKIEMSEISAGVKAAMGKAQDNAALLISTSNLTLMNPIEYSKNVIKELNRLGKRMKSTPISKKLQNALLEHVNDYEQGAPYVTVWDIIEIFWEAPSLYSESEVHQRSLEKTMSRILTLNHLELDK